MNNYDEINAKLEAIAGSLKTACKAKGIEAAVTTTRMTSHADGVVELGALNIYWTDQGWQMAKVISWPGSYDEPPGWDLSDTGEPIQTVEEAVDAVIEAYHAAEAEALAEDANWDAYAAEFAGVE